MTSRDIFFFFFKATSLVYRRNIGPLKPSKTPTGLKSRRFFKFKNDVNYLFPKVDHFLPRLNEQFGVTDHFLAVNFMHSVSGTDVRIHHPVVDGAVLLLRRHLVPGRAVLGPDPLPLLHDLLRHGVDGGEVIKLLLFHTVAVEARHGRGGHLWFPTTGLLLLLVGKTRKLRGRWAEPRHGEC